MIIIRRKELMSVVKSFVIANTPYSLYRELSTNPVISRVRDGCSLQELLRYYDYVTARGSRTEVSMGLAYLVFVAANMKLLESGQLLRSQIDVSRLRWGKVIQEYMQMRGGNTQTFLISGISPTQISSTESPGVDAEADRFDLGIQYLWRPEHD